ncbi:MAG: energy transducer TonB [Deltaproteobacteria bacterium]|nr:energy transducer TonB [Kofleriaceae bacterium]
MTQVGTRRRGKRHERAALAASVLVAAIVHALLVEGADATGMLAGWGGMGASDEREPDAIAMRPLDPSCDGDALLAAAARLSTCATPFATDAEACVREVSQRLESDRLRCHADELPSVAFTLSPIDTRELEPIDPEPLLEMLSEERQQAFEKKQEELQVALAREAEQRKTAAPKEAQVVEIAKPNVELAPDNARFLSEYDNKVEKEQVARGTSHEEIVAKSKPAELEVKEDPREATAAPREPDLPGTNPEAPRAPGLMRMRAPGAEQPSQVAQEAHQKGMLGGLVGPIGDGVRARRGDGLITSEERRVSDEPRGEGGGGGGTPLVPNLRPSEDVLERAAGGGNVDFLDDVSEGEETALNSKQWVFASFFNRMKRRVHQNWDPVSIWHRHDPTGQVYGYKTRITRVRVTLDASGQMTRIVVSSPSGVDLLDEEAVRAFRAAQPFPNPPGGLVDATGNITFEFGFHLQIGGGQKASWKIFRTL